MRGALAEVDLSRESTQGDFRTRFGNELQQLKGLLDRRCIIFFCEAAFGGRKGFSFSVASIVLHNEQL
jgi:hypothetical protein